MQQITLHTQVIKYADDNSYLFLHNLSKNWHNDMHWFHISLISCHFIQPTNKQGTMYVY